MTNFARAITFAIVLCWSIPIFAAPGDSALLQRADFLKLLDEGRVMLANDDASGACPQFFYILQNGDDLEAYYRLAELDLARCLMKAGLPLSAYLYAGRVVDAGKAHPAFLDALPLLLALAEDLDGDISLLERLATYELDDLPENSRDRVHFLAGKFLYNQGDLEEATKRFNRVGTDDTKLYLSAKFLSGVIDVRQGRMKKGLETFKDVLRYREGSGVRDEFATKVYTLTYLNIARLFYSVGDFETALRYYDRIERFTPMWLQALFESSWAYFRLGNFSKAMGNLWTISSPYFEDEFYPEAFLIEANILFENCHYDEALAIITKFHEQYYKLYTELKTQLKKYDDPNEFYYYLARLANKGGNLSLELKRIFNAAFMNRNLRRMLAMVVRISTEQTEISALTRKASWNELASELQVEVDSYRDLIIGEAGDLSKTRLREVYSEIKGLLAKGIKLKIETINARKKISETSDSFGAGTDIDPSEFAGADESYWPFNGEFWIDELDAYYFVIESVCTEP